LRFSKLYALTLKETPSDSRSEGKGVQIKLLKEISLLLKQKEE
jgi:hypothetical protein